jgi:hypothetical protein
MYCGIKIRKMCDHFVPIPLKKKKKIASQSEHNPSAQDGDIEN